MFQILAKSLFGSYDSRSYTNVVRTVQHKNVAHARSGMQERLVPLVAQELLV